MRICYTASSVASSLLLVSGVDAFHSTRTVSDAFLVSTKAPSFVTAQKDRQSRKPSRSPLMAKPSRLPDNEPGVVYVNDKCINCAACSSFAPSVFSRSEVSSHHIVSHQPETPDEIETARAALAACPVAAIRVETLAERRHRALNKDAVEAEWTDRDESLVRRMGLREKKPFPRPFLTPKGVPDVYWVGHHNDASFGATPYLLRADVNGVSTWIMVDTPRFSSSAAKDVRSLTGDSGPNYLFLTHVDDTADHDKWAKEFPNLMRIFHSGDLGPSNWRRDEELNHVEVILPKVETERSSDETSLVAYSLNGELLGDDWLTSTTTNTHPVVILHTPGHSRGSCTLFRRPVEDSSIPGVLFTGDAYAYTTRDGGRMTGFPRYGNSLRTQADTLERLLQLDWDVVAPGHGHPRDYRGEQNKRDVQARELRVAQEELLSSRRRW